MTKFKDMFLCCSVCSALSESVPRSGKHVNPNSDCFLSEKHVKPNQIFS